jgi:hypothetical protein
MQANSSFKSLFRSNEFKTFVVENLSSNTLMSSILQNTEQESLLLAGILYHQSLNRNHKKQLYSEINKFQSFPLAGIHVSKKTSYSSDHNALELTHFSRC